MTASESPSAMTCSVAYGIGAVAAAVGCDAILLDLHGAMVAQHLRLSDTQLAGVFPGYGGGVMSLFG